MVLGPPEVFAAWIVVYCGEIDWVPIAQATVNRYGPESFYVENRMKSIFITFS